MTQKIQLSTIIIVIVSGVLLFYYGTRSPSSFPIGEKFQVHEGESLYSISRRLEADHIINSALIFRGWVSFLRQDKDVRLGAYNFSSRVPLSVVIAKFIQGPDEPLLSVTIPEGHTTEEIAHAYKKALPSLSVAKFLQLVKEGDVDGYLFPSTYYPLPSYNEKDIISLMRVTFEKEYAKNFKELPFPKKVPTERDVVSLASLLEGEAKTPEDMRIVSGILQKRLENGMRLQVDAAKITYAMAGLPSKPINNPGLIAMSAVFRPIRTTYFYYLTGHDGKMYYSRTFEEHKRNIQKHLY